MKLLKKNRCSRLRHRLTLQQELQTPDGVGGYDKSWQDVATLWAEIIPVTTVNSKLTSLAGKEILFADKIESQISHRVIMRYRADIDASMRLVFDSRVFNIRYVANPEEGNYALELLVQEGTGT